MKYDVNNANQRIIWGADDPALYSFPERKRIDDGVEPRVYTVFTYYKERYNVTLRYPKMPLIFLGNKEWFPIEFLSQSFGKMRAANKPEQVKAVLEYYDQNAGSRNIVNIKDMVGFFTVLRRILACNPINSMNDTFGKNEIIRMPLFCPSYIALTGT